MSNPHFSFDFENFQTPPELLTYADNFVPSNMRSVSYYKRLQKIGQGTFGEVFKARNTENDEIVALKKILMENEKEGVQLIEICSEKTGENVFAFYLVFSFCDHDLGGLLSSNQIMLQLPQIKTMLKHILSGLEAIHRSNVLHRDIKAANILITHDGILRIADFGLARLDFRQGQASACFTNNVVTLWYRPPELLLGARDYGKAIDIWGVGCIMAEMWTRSPILKGDSEQRQLCLISELCGSINGSSWPKCRRLPLYNRLELPQNLPKRIRERFYDRIQNDDAISLLEAMLTLNPEHRPDAGRALDHDFFYTHPLPLENIKLLVSTLPANLFEYTMQCGAHANRSQVVPNISY
ncbi:protein kinase domain-containing protein [Ditylenchus destructor]|uniref:Protein kinase domain-containing protein n=1 Tax=Ditylenchus destructor TaxID=166010 RepID=A0AAD4RB15_9BILA|nr:protein kinase domain-containing protein [Ditylenchus destructor]